MKYLILIGLFIATASTVQSQDTCKTFSQKNPHGAAMTISRVWILDSVNFRIRSIQPLPYQEAASGSFDFEVCILARDGKKYSTQVRYMTTHGAVSYPVSNFQAPGGVSAVARDQGSYVHRIYPNPARTSIAIEGSVGSDWVIYDIGGVARLSGVTAASGESLDVTALLPGSYIIKVTTATGDEESQYLIIQ